MLSNLFVSPKTKEEKYFHDSYSMGMICPAAKQGKVSVSTATTHFEFGVSKGVVSVDPEPFPWLAT